MDVDGFDRALRSLGLHGPMGEMRLPKGQFVLIYKMPDGSHKWLPPPSTMTAEQRDEQIADLKRHLGIT